jgi:hypothetical protein
MALSSGTYTFGPQNASLLVHTTRTGAAAKAGHDLTIEITSWSGTLQLDGDEGSVALEADGGSLRVLDGTGGVTSLSQDDKAGISQTIDDEVLKRTAITYRSSRVQAAGDRLRVSGELTLLGKTLPKELELDADDGRLTGSAVVTQTELGMKPYSILFGTLKVSDEVRITIDAKLN